jgi:hypothetical protein
MSKLDSAFDAYRQLLILVAVAFDCSSRGGPIRRLTMFVVGFPYFNLAPGFQGLLSSFFGA